MRMSTIPPLVQFTIGQQLVMLGGKEEILLFSPFSTFPRFILGLFGYGYISTSFDTNGAGQHIKRSGALRISIRQNLRFSWTGFSLAAPVKCLPCRSFWNLLKENFHINLFAWLRACRQDPLGSTPLFFCPFHTNASTTSASPPPGPQPRTTTVAIPQQRTVPAPS